MAAAKKTVVACECLSCGRQLRVHPKDDPKAAIKRARWSNVQGDTGICRPCGKKGNR